MSNQEAVLDVPAECWAGVVKDEGPNFYIDVQKVPVPEIGPEDVLIKLNATGICRSDIHMMLNDMAMPKMSSLGTQCAGHEGAGVIVRVGERVKKFKGVSDYVAAPTMCSGATSLSALRTSGLNAGQWAVFPGGGGGVGIQGVQLAAAMGLRAIVVDTGSERKELCLKLGAEHFVDFREGDPVPEVMELTSGGAHACFVTAAQSYPVALNYLGARRGAKLICIGVAAPGEYNINLDPARIVFRGQHVLGTLTSSLAEVDDALDFAKRGKLRLEPTVVGLSAFNGAVQKMKNGQVAGVVHLSLESRPPEEILRMSTVQIQAANGRSVQVPTGLFINNEFVPSKNNNIIDVTSPHDGKVLAKLASAQKADVDAAVDCAAAALQAGWRATSGTDRGKLLRKLADLIERDAEDFATLEAVDAGILYGDSLHINVKQTLDTLRFYADLATQSHDQLLEIPNGMAYTRREPFGICAAIVPWNGPLMITSWKIGPAIAAGNNLIIKSSELSPLYGQKLGQLIVEAGFPPGVFSILCGLGQEAGQAIAEHPLIRKLSFTGSARTGRSLLRASANTNLKKVSLELGGKGPSIVFPDANLDNAVFWTSLGSSSNNGQICALGSRIYVHEAIYDEFITKFKAHSAQEPGQHERIMSYIKKGQEEGAKLLFGGNNIGDNFVEHTIFTDVKEDMTIVKEEIFGPVATISKFSHEADALHKANDSEYGLAAAIFTSDIARAKRVSDALEVGMVTVNCWGMINANTPFGGVKQSGFGREMGREALEDWTTVKTVKHFFLPSAN
ncbi:putative aldehyde dehydrogenase [Cladophialophora carrionii]|uniref:aldehyde dehydrogenase (NAD(+)) n=1 Tax=Cladophialophora carrionii TaxID=86049 RepID=A0A1C1CLY9_9EURO|nr:putative aldehyde dehydrogenase [Cladophialophora carrionii]